MHVAIHLKQPTRRLGRAALKRLSIWSCTGRGLPSFPGHPGNWCALTAPFHPYPATHSIEQTQKHLFDSMSSWAVYSLLHFPSRHRDSTLWSVLPCGVRTFLPVLIHPATVCSSQTEIKNHASIKNINFSCNKEFYCTGDRISIDCHAELRCTTGVEYS